MTDPRSSRRRWASNAYRRRIHHHNEKGSALRRTLPEPVAFVTVAGVLFVALWASGAPAAVYPLYADQQGASVLTTTALFATYPVALVAALLLRGGASDITGRRAALTLSLAITSAGTSVFVATDWLPALFAARTLQGFGVGIGMSAASAALIDYSQTIASRRASATNTAATAGGTAAAFIVSGLLVQYAPQPTHGPFVPLLAASTVLLCLVRFLPETQNPTVRLRAWRPAPIRVPTTNRRTYALGVASISVAFMTGAVVLAVGAQILRDLVGITNAFSAALGLSAWALAIIPAANTARRMTPSQTTRIGGPLAAGGMAGIVLAGHTGSLAVLVAAAIVSGAGYGLMFYGGLGLVTAAAAPHERAGTLSGMYVVAYLLQGATAVLIGWLTVTYNLNAAIISVLPGLAGTCLAVSIAAWFRAPGQQRESTNGRS